MFVLRTCTQHIKIHHTYATSTYQPFALLNGLASDNNDINGKKIQKMNCPYKQTCPSSGQFIKMNKVLLHNHETPFVFHNIDYLLYIHQ